MVSMLATLLTKVVIAAIVLIILLALLGRRILRSGVFLFIFFFIYISDNFLMVVTIQYPSLQLIPARTWEGFLISNWSGKLYSIVFAFVLLYFSRRVLSRDEIGLTLRQKEGSLLACGLVTLTLTGWATIVGINSPKGIFDILTLGYLALLPALNEELVYRGCLLGILNKLLPQKINLFGAWMGWGAVVTSLLFSLLHGFGFNNDLSIYIDAIALRNSFVSGFIFAWLRERSGSLLMPVIAHGMEDFFFFLPRML
jgi:membrane protease YdiL (CAAX protease family)